MIGHTYIFTKGIDNIKFTISLKSYEEKAFAECPQSLFIFYNSFSLRLTENFHEHKYFLKTLSTYFVYIIFL